MNRMTENLLFIRGLQSHTDRFQILLGPQWPAFLQQWWHYWQRLLAAKDDATFNLVLDDFYYTMTKSDAKQLVRSLFRQARQQAGSIDSPTPMIRMLDPTTNQERNILIHITGSQANRPVASRSEVIAAGRALADSLATEAGFIIDDAGHLTTGNVLPAEEEESPGDTETYEGTEKKAGLDSSTQLIKTYPNVRGDDYALLQKRYTLTVKLSDQPQQEGEHTSSSELTVEAKADDQTKKIQVVLHAPDFDLEDQAKGWQRTLTLYLEARASNERTFHLQPRERFAEKYFAGLKLQFLAEGEVIGEAFRWVEVLQNEAVDPTPVTKFPEAPGYPLDEAGKSRTKPATEPRHVPLGPLPPDNLDQRIHLTVTIEEDPDNPADMRWLFASSYLPDESLPPGRSPNLGAEEFVKEFLAPFGMPGHWHKPHMDDQGQLYKDSVPTLLGNLIRLRNHAPDQFWRVYEQVLQAHLDWGRPPETLNILLRTSDTHIPWELMPVTKAVQDNKMPLLLGSAHRVGRWLQGVIPSTPPLALKLHGLALAAPVYVKEPLPEAQLERQYLEQRYHPAPVLQTPGHFRTFLLDGQPTGGAGILHFAGHGNCCTDPIRGNWLILSDDGDGVWYDINAAGNDLGNRLGKLGRDVVAFFNACNVGRSAEGPLGSNGGWGRALLDQNYKGYIGPLWSVYDKHARDISQTFYELALDKQQPLGEVMRQIRLKFAADNRLFTYLAYLYLGHPMAKIHYTPTQGA